MSYSARQWIRYRFDTFMARGGRSIFISLTLVFLTLLTVISGLRILLYEYASPTDSQNERDLLRNVYVTFLEMTDPGNMNQDVFSSIEVKIFAIVAGLSGLVMLSSLIAFITTALDQKLSELKKGHSKVIENGHTLLLGWNERVLEILRELLLANESEDDPIVVILADVDKEFMDDYIHVNMPDTKNTRVVTRSGTPSSLVNLDMVSLEAAKSVIVLAACNQGASDDEKKSSDAVVVKTVLALMTSLASNGGVSIVAEVFDERNRVLVDEISPDISTIDTDEILAKILVQTSRSVGLSVVYSEILSFDGCEMYFHHADWGEVDFGELAFRWPDGIPLGLRHEDGSIEINPPIDRRLEPGDDVLILAEDDSTIEYVKQPVARPRDFPLAGRKQEMNVERALIIGWTPKVETVITEYADYVLEGSRIDIMLRAPDASVEGRVDRLNEKLGGVSVHLVAGDPLTTEGLTAVRPFTYDNIIILSQGGEDADDERTDSETIVILLLLRKIFDQHRAQGEQIETRLITEILDSENQPLVSRAGVQDFIISNRFVSMVVAQLSEDAEIKAVYDDLFQEDGSEIYLKPVDLYFERLPSEVSYADLIYLAQKRGEVCLGVKLKEHELDADRNFGVKLIPDKNTRYALKPDDTIVVLAQDET